MNERKIKYLTIGMLTMVIVNVILLVLLILPQAGFKSKHTTHPRHPNRGAEFLIRNLKLSDQQRDEFRELFKSHKPKMDSIERQLHVQKSRLFQLSLKGEVDSTQADSLINVISGLHKKHQLEMLDHFSRLRQICTPEQRAELANILKKTGNLREKSQ